MKQATFRIVHFLKPNKYIGMAWNYDQAVLVSTIPFDTYSEARNQLEQDCSIVGVELKWYDGKYTCAGNNEQLIPASWTEQQPTINRITH
jgi:hypothetical protein